MEARAGELVSGRAHHERAGLRERLEPGGDVQGLAEGGRVGTVGPDDDQADVHSHSRGQAQAVARLDPGVQLVEARQDVEAGVHGQRRVVLVRHRPAEPGRHAVARVDADAALRGR